MKKLALVQIMLIASILFATLPLKAKSILLSTNANDIKWTTIDAALTANKKDNKKFIFVHLYTDWCGWCKKMDENTFQDGGVATLINNNFTPVKFNAENQNPVEYKGKTYNFNKTGSRGANQLALDLGSIGGKLGYPTLVILDENGNKLQAFPGFKDTETITAILKYFISGSYKTMDFQQFQTGQ